MAVQAEGCAGAPGCGAEWEPRHKAGRDSEEPSPGLLSGTLFATLAHD